MIVQLPDGTLWQDNGDGTYSQLATGFDDPAASGIDPGTVTQLDTLPVAGQPAPPEPAPGTYAIGPINTPEEAAAIAAQGPLEPAPSPLAATLTVAAPPPPLTLATPVDTRSLQVALPPLPVNSFEWFGQDWHYGQLVDFKAALAAHGDNFDTWADAHPEALKLLTVGVSPLAVAAAQVAAAPDIFTQPIVADPNPTPAAQPGPLFPPGYTLTFPALPGEAPYVVAPSGVPATTAPGELAPAPGSPTGIPSGVLDHRNLERVWVLAGGPTEHADVAAAIAEAESSGDPSRIDNTEYPDRPGFHEPPKGSSPEWSVGLWQINLVAHPNYLTTDMLQPLQNGQAAVAISNGGTDFGAWTTYTDGAYEQYLQGAPPPGGFEAAPGAAAVTPAKVPPGAASAWADIIDLAATGVSRHSAAVESAADALVGVFQ